MYIKNDHERKFCVKNVIINNLLLKLKSMEYTSKEVYEYISKQTNDPIVERKTCAVSGTLFPIYKSDLEFYEKV